MCAVGISIRKLKKDFAGTRGTITAVKNLSMDMYEGQILALLGHNGAGKVCIMCCCGVIIHWLLIIGCSIG
jgi:ABC-type multidrug transport system ATPase subunit